MKPSKKFLIVVSVGLALLVLFLAFTGPGKIDVDALQSRGAGPQLPAATSSAP